jgi:hypothetical protein
VNVAGERRVSLNPNQKTGRKQVVVAAVQAHVIASGAFEAVECLEQIERAGERKYRQARLGRGPAGIAGRITEMAADVEARPIVGCGFGSSLDRVVREAVGAECAAQACRQDEDTEHKPFRHGTRFPETCPFEIYRLTATGKMTVGDENGNCVCLLS